MKFTEHEMVFFNSITKGNDVFGIPLKFRPQKGHEEEVKKTINGLIEKGVLASETELTKMGFFPARALECYKESRNHIIINYLHIALLEQREAIVIIPLKNREYEMLRLPRVAVLYLLLKIYLTFCRTKCVKYFNLNIKLFSSPLLLAFSLYHILKLLIEEIPISCSKTDIYISTYLNLTPSLKYL